MEDEDIEYWQKDRLRLRKEVKMKESVHLPAAYICFAVYLPSALFVVNNKQINEINEKRRP